MEPYFKNNAIWEKYLRVIHSWKDTPFRHMKMEKGRGADCMMFIGGTWIEMGILQKAEFEYYPRDWPHNDNKEVLLEYAEHHIRNCLCPGFLIERYSLQSLAREYEPMRGDVITYATVRKADKSKIVTNHSGLYIGENQQMMTIEKIGVHVTTYTNWWKRIQTYAFRVFKES